MRNYEKLFANTADLMCELGRSSLLKKVNPTFREVIGPRADEPGTELLDLFEIIDRHWLSRAFDELSESEPTSTVEGRMQTADGNVLWTSWQLTLVGEDEVLAIGRDISKQRQTEQQLESKTAFLHSIIEAEPECVKLVSITGELLDMNAAGLRMIGAPSREEAIGQNVYDLMAPEDRERFVAFNEEVCAGQGGDLSFDIIAMNGERRSMETTAVPLRGEQGGELLHLAITRDVTQRHLLEAQLRQAQRMEAIGQLSGGIAHDFNNLLTAIIGPAELALDTLDPNHPVAEDLREIKTTGERAARLTQQLLSFSRKQDIKLELINVADLVGTTKEMLTRLLGEPYSLELAPADETHPVRADRGQLEQVLINLVINSRDALDEGGHIRVAVFNEEVTKKRAQRLGCHPGPHVALSVSDDGSGISADALPHVFDPFFTTKAAGTGTGLGLATCIGIVTQLNGAIDIISLEKVGTTFTVLLPAITEPVTIPTPPPASREQGNAERILLVEDDDAVRTAVTRMLTSLGYEVETAHNAEEALRQTTDLDNLALVVTDITMPGMSGQTMANHLLEKRKDLPVVMMTGYLSSTVNLDEIDERMLLHKPFTTNELSAAVQRALHPAPPRQPTS